MNDQKRLTCPKCGQLMTRMVVNNPMEEGWRVSYRCLKCGKMGPLVRGGRQEETEKMAELLTESWIRRLKGEKEEQPERLRAWAEALEANRALKTSEDYQKLSEALLGRKDGKTAELLEAALRMKREGEKYKYTAIEFERQYNIQVNQKMYWKDRLEHLLESKLICSFNEKNLHGYVRDIKEADEYEAKEAVEKIKRELASYEGAGLRYEEEIAKLKQMAAEDILQAAQCKCPCNSCTRNPMDRGCTFEECEKCDDHCTCYECHDSESYVWRGGK